MSDEMRAAAAYGSKMNPEIVKSRVNTYGAILSVNYGAAADELTGYETALKESLATVTPAPSVTEVRYLQEYQRETARAMKKYGGGCALREAAAIARLWCGSEFGPPPGRGLAYTTLQKVAFDLFGVTLPESGVYSMQSIYAEETYDPVTVSYFLGGTTAKTRCEVSETYEKETREKGWLRAVVAASHQGTGKEFWIRWTPIGLRVDDIYAEDFALYVQRADVHHPAGLEGTYACWWSMEHQGTGSFFDVTDLEEGTPRVDHFTGITIGSDNAIELFFVPSDLMERIGNKINEYHLANDWEILWSAP
jgi:hypothetical protein